LQPPEPPPATICHQPLPDSPRPILGPYVNSPANTAYAATNATAAGRAQNRRVEVRVGGDGRIGAAPAAVEPAAEVEAVEEVEPPVDVEDIEIVVPEPNAVDEPTLPNAREFKIYFEEGSYALSSDYLQILDGVALLMKGDANAKLDVVGHLDPSEGNVALGGMRADRVEIYLIGKEIDGDRINTRSARVSEPADTSGAPENRWKNRRVELRMR